MSRWAIVVQVCQIFIGMSGQGFTTSEPKVHGRTIWKTLQTNEFRVAKLRAPKELGDLQKGRNALSSLERGSATFGSLAELYKVRIQPRKSGDLITPHSDGLVELYRFVVGHRLELRNVSW